MTGQTENRKTVTVTVLGPIPKITIMIGMMAVMGALIKMFTHIPSISSIFRDRPIINPSTIPTTRLNPTPVPKLLRLSITSSKKVLTFTISTVARITLLKGGMIKTISERPSNSQKITQMIKEKRMGTRLPNIFISTPRHYSTYFLSIPQSLSTQSK